MSPTRAKELSLERANKLDLEVKAHHCDSCGKSSCRCQLNDGGELYETECFKRSSSCTTFKKSVATD